MTYATGTFDDFIPLERSRRPRSVVSQALVGALALTVGGFAGSWILEHRTGAVPDPAQVPTAPPGALAQARTVNSPEPIPSPNSSGPYNELLDPNFSLGPAPVAIGQNPPLEARFLLFGSQAETAAAEPTDVAPVEEQALPRFALNAPLPMPRPPELRPPNAGPDVGPNVGPMPLTGRQMQRQNRVAAVAPPAPDNRNFFQKLFGVTQPSGASQPSGPVLAYAAPQDDAIGNARTPRFSLPSLSLPQTSPSVATGPQTAIYDITARTVYMPNGEKLEAHSGLGSRMDDPRHVHVKMQGPTPPATYDLTLRETLFHGVQALRLTPVGGGEPYGRNGLLAHSYMLGPKGDSNGCVSFRDYNKFLQAFMRGEIKRLVVVARMS